MDDVLGDYSRCGCARELLTPVGLEGEKCRNMCMTISALTARSSRAAELKDSMFSVQIFVVRHTRRRHYSQCCALPLDG